MGPKKKTTAASKAVAVKSKVSKYSFVDTARCETRMCLIPIVAESIGRVTDARMNHLFQGIEKSVSKPTAAVASAPVDSNERYQNACMYFLFTDAAIDEHAHGLPINESRILLSLSVSQLVCSVVIEACKS